MSQKIINVLVSAGLVLLSLAMLWFPRTTTINNPAPPDTCKCPPPLTLEQQEQQEKYERCVQMKARFEAQFGSGPYEMDCEQYRPKL